MSRIREIYDQIIQEATTQSALNALKPNIESSQKLLSDLTSTSKVARWRLIFWVVAVAIYTHEVIVLNLLNRRKEYNALYYQRRAFEFQYGDPLVLKDGKHVYASIDESKRIIKRCSVTEAPDSRIILKVAKENGGVIMPLSNIEKTAFNAYVALVKVFGIKYLVVSESADTMQFGAEIFYDPLVLNADGSLISNPAVFPVENTIKNFITNLPFDGIFYLASLIDAIQRTEGVVNVVENTCDVKYGLYPYDSVLNMQGRSYNPNSGYLNISSAPGEQLSDLLNYVAHV